MGGEAGMLELTDGQRERVNELQALADAAKDGDQGARRRLRAAHRHSAPARGARGGGAGPPAAGAGWPSARAPRKWWRDARTPQPATAACLRKPRAAETP